MNRTHSTDQGEMAIRLAQQVGFNNISIDLIYGLPNLTNEQWLEHLERALRLNVQHISSYCLTIESKTELHHLVREGKLTCPSEDQQGEQFELLVSTLKNAGFEQYEISNFAFEQHYAKHNASYWNFTPYVGVGPSAHSFNGIQRRWNIANNTNYYQHVGKDDQWFEVEELTPNARWNEYFLTGLRTKWGVLKKLLENMGGMNAEESKLLVSYLETDFMTADEDRLVLTDKGMLQADGIASSFFRLD
jgi:oxygen-independent coproporphyrinogen-3 oxidase